MQPLDQATLNFLSELLPADPDAPDHWTSQAICGQADPEVFFPEGQGTNGAAGKRLCFSCPVRTDCLEYAIANREKYGVWGGMSPKERSAEIRRRGLPRKRRGPAAA